MLHTIFVIWGVVRERYFMFDYELQANRFRHWGPFEMGGTSAKASREASHRTWSRSHQFTRTPQAQVNISHLVAGNKQ